VAGVPYVAAAFFTPIAGDPNGPAMRWTSVASGDPDVAVAIPAMVAGNPDPVHMRGRRGGNDFDGMRRRWADADNDLRVGRADAEKNCAGCGEDLFLHGFHHSFSTASGLRCDLLWKVVRKTYGL